MSDPKEKTSDDRENSPFSSYSGGVHCGGGCDDGKNNERSCDAERVSDIESEEREESEEKEKRDVAG
jgi:hypothetical protein